MIIDFSSFIRLENEVVSELTFLIRIFLKMVAKFRIIEKLPAFYGN